MSDRNGLEGIRVLEVAGGFGSAYAAKLFADLGADVLRLETAEDVVRSRPYEVHRWLNANKRSVTAGLAELIAGADIVLHDFSPAKAAARGLNYRDVAAANPAVVLCSITPFGMTGPYSEFAAEELTLIHASSWGFLSPSASNRADLPPLKAPGHHATIISATVAATAALAAFERAERMGIGAHVDFSVFAAAAKLTETAPASVSFAGEDASRLGVKTLVPWGIYECRDGLMQFICVEEAHWQALVKLMGDPEWAHLEVFATNAVRRENSDLVELYLSEWMATQSVDELYHAGQAVRLCMSPVNTMAQLAVNGQFEARGFFTVTVDGLKVPGSGFQTDQGWWRQRLAAPALGEHDGQGWLPRAPSKVSPTASAPDVGPQRPLEGVRVCDFTWIWAGPFCTQYLAHLGADVIRLESPEHLCLMRRLNFPPKDTELTPNTAGMFQLYNSDKRSVGIDLGHAEAREIVRKLVAMSDIVIDNFAVGTMASLGFGVEDLRQINPNVIVVSLTGYGQNGPAADYMAYGPAGGAVAGLYAANGYTGGKAAETGIAIGDPCTGVTALWSVVSALSARRRTGAVARIDVAMVEAIAATVGEPWMQFLSTGDVPVPAGNHDPLWSPHNCYPADGEDRWVTIACPTEASWLALCSVLDPAMAQDARFVTASDRKQNEAALDELLSVWTATRDRWDITNRLQAVGVAAFPSLTPLELWTGDPQLEAIGMLEQPEHALTGRHTVPGLPWRLTPGPNGLRRAAPTLGQHTEEVLCELLGYTPTEVQQLTQSGVLRR